MRRLRQLARRFNRPRREIGSGLGTPAPRPPLREFVYLDEVSLRSLLSSQRGEMIDSTSESSAEAAQAEVSAALGANPGLVAKAEVGSRFQTSNSSTIQTSRKATVQSWFKELHSIPGLRLIETAQPKAPAEDLETLKSTVDTSLLVQSRALRRGALVEFRVRLKADPVFHLGMLVSEFSAMAEEYPDMFSASNSLAALHEVRPINKILQRLLAGLIPIRAEAVDYSVVVLDGVEHVVHRELIEGLDLEARPLQIVGVTEHLAYWRDIRRVLFSEADFVLLGRLARDGLDDTWTPVKLADLFQDLAPGLVEQINAAGRLPFGPSRLVPPVTPPESQLGRALRTYSRALLEVGGRKLQKGKRGDLEARISALEKRTSSVSDQRAAFRAVRTLLEELTGVDVDPTLDLQLRDTARTESGLPLFPALTSEVATPSVPMAPTIAEDADGPRLLDVEVVAIYW